MARKIIAKPKEFLFRDQLFQLALFIIAVFLITGWINYHLSDSEWLTVTLSFFTILYAVFGQIVGLATDDGETMMKKNLRAALLWCLKTPVLVFLYVLILAVGSSVSVISVFADGANEKVKVSIAREGRDLPSDIKELNGRNQKVAFIGLTNPFGRSYYLEASGYLRHSFELYPWIGKRIRLTDDLRPKPNLLLRMMVLPKTLEGGKFVISQEGVSVECSFPEAGGHGAMLIGKAHTISEELINQWERSLIAQTPAGESAENFSSTITKFVMGWTNYLGFDPGLDLMPGSTIHVKFLNRNQIKIAETDLTITDQSFQDFLIKTK